MGELKRVSIDIKQEVYDLLKEHSKKLNVSMKDIILTGIPLGINECIKRNLENLEKMKKVLNEEKPYSSLSSKK